MRNHTVVVTMFPFSPHQAERVTTQSANISISSQEKAILNSELKLGPLNGSLGNLSERELETQKASGRSFKFYVGFNILKAVITIVLFILCEKNHQEMGPAG